MPSESAVGAHMDEETTVEALAFQFCQAEGSGGKEPSPEHWDRARQELAHRSQQAAPSRASSSPSQDDMRVEEAMHLDR